jgi:hypothetical protein
MFLGALFSVATFWLLLLGVTGPNLLYVLGGVLSLVGAFVSFRYYRDQLRAESDSSEES